MGFIFGTSFLIGFSFADNFSKCFVEQRSILLKESDQVRISFIQDYDLDSHGNIWMIDWDNSELFKFNDRGESPVLIATRGKGPGELVSPQSIYIDKNDSVFVATFGNRVTQYDAKGNYLYAFITVDGHIPTNCVAVNSRGSILVGGPKKKRNKGLLAGEMVHMYSPTGAYLKSFCQMDSKVGEMSLEGYSAVFFDLDRNDNLYTVQSVNFLITVFDENGNMIKSFGEKGNHYRKPGILMHAIERDETQMENFLRNFTYVMDIFVFDKRVAILSRNYPGKYGNKYAYFIDIYDSESGKLIAGEIESDMILYRIKNNDFYFLRTIAKGPHVPNVIKVYRLR